MRIGIITVHNGQNYGASLQAFALVKVLRDMGHGAYLIDYRTRKVEERMRGYTQLGSWNSLASAGHNIKRIGSNFLFHTDKHYQQVRKRFNEFHEPLFESPHQVFCDSPELVRLNDRYDAFVCGSDQIWNRTITDLDGAFFLDFAGGDKITAAYAPSLGMPSNMVDEETAAIIRGKLAGIRYLSIREDNNRELIEFLSGRECRVVADPVILPEREDWLRAAEQAEDVCPPEPYAFYYPVVEQQELQAFALKESRKRGIRLLNPRLVPKYAKMKGFDAFARTAAGPLEFLKLLIHSEVVFTNSFHATVFSTIFNKEMYSLQMKGRHSNRNNRMLEYLRMTQLLDSQSPDGNCIRIEPFSNPDLESILENQRTRSRGYLQNVFDSGTGSRQL
ncbi:MULTISPECIES: polysaccharide pyruvyl transferase family protein [unclassified Clostridium]|uniref:polysaccharide pyruvyl transferase family protein n=1 Tax=unclassified Clostridium TaxID=2614128 RepID=UPI0014868819|nr:MULTISPECIES: polysaccharide pyruvyl transferase family protein [unclassified Clostridium]